MSTSLQDARVALLQRRLWLAESRPGAGPICRCGREGRWQTRVGSWLCLGCFEGFCWRMRLGVERVA